MNAETTPQPSTESHLWLTGRIVVGVDGSEGSRSALRHAIQLAYVGGASVEAVSAWEAPIIYGPMWTALPWDPADEARALLQETIASTFGDDVPDNFVATAREGASAAVLIEASRDADLLVVGSRGHGGFAGLLLGSVSSACAEHAHCPVLVVHDHGARLPHPAASAGLDR